MVDASETPSCPGCIQRDREIAGLRGEIATLAGRIEALERSVKRQAAPFSKGPPKAAPKTPGRKSGADYGKQSTRPDPDRIDEVHCAALPRKSPCCRAAVRWTRRGVQYQTEIVRRRVQRRFDIEIGCCTKCGKRIQGRHPLQTSDALGAARSQLGAEAKALIVQMNKELGVSYGKIRRFFQTTFGIVLSRGGACQSLLKAASRAEGAYRQIAQGIRRSRKLTPDETGWKVGGVLWWMWDFVTPRALLYRIAPSRGFDVIEEVLGADWAGRTTHDGWSPYDRLEKATHQQCLGHFLVRCKNLLEVATRGAVRFPRSLKAVLKASLALRDRRDARQISPHGLAVATGRLESRMDRLLAGTKTHAANARFAKHLSRHRDQLFAFLEHPGMDATNFRAEQAIRPAVVNRKVWGGNRTPNGAHAQEVLASVLATCALRDHDAFDFLVLLIRQPSRASPLLIPA